MKPLRVLVTGARAYYALQVIRCLGRRGHSVTAADSDPHATGFYSRYTAATWVYPRIDRDHGAWFDALRTHLRREPHDVILPLYEEALALSRYAPALAGLASIPVGDYAGMMQLHDKRLLYELAARIGVPVPRTRVVAGPLPADVTFPLVVKVGQSSSARGVAIVHSAREFEKAWHAMQVSHGLPGSVPAIVQDFVDGEQLCTLSFAWRGACKGTLVYRNLCEFPRNGGAGIVRTSIHHAEIAKHVQTLIEANGSHGVVGFDFMIDRNGRPWLTDANPRPTPGIFLAQRCGLDLVGMAVGSEEPSAAAVVRAGLRTRIDPIVALWMLRSLLPGRDYWRRLRMTLSLLIPKRCSASDFFSIDDLRSLRALPIAALDAVRTLLRGSGGLLETVAASQYRDY
jgi:predicted ATP-grasp superfamily ATP-dependent carboligase